MAKLTKNAVRAALMKAHGNISAASRSLDVTRRALVYHMQKHPELEQIVTQARESMVDDAETSLARAILEGEAWAVCFTLKTQGRHRGYIEKREVDFTEKVRKVIVEEVVIADGDDAGAEASRCDPAGEDAPHTNGVL